ncbi:GNAT family [Colletotrichum higginsianum IMI 349063]|uniref:GNAT family n=2 Tax=Colletotrichum higginsianum TaxID=80884 RepID=A0A1B7YL88_COLHI|nr:GNAT family [Colletotrichum higginsianum IMI 349063]OBR12813.1 GNAT family [Colletotrichum higginsianum IMI 349063]TIC99206.1 Spermidine N(1)-acetyltransferase [Colletotrichum higginsianum]GJC94488.1 GNAT family [Colletotrichum higginsianum]
MITDGHENAYRSERLIYRAVENNEADSTFIHTQLENDPVNVALSDLKLLKPRSSKHSHAMTEQMAKSVLTVMVCLPHGAGAGAGAGDKDKTDGSQAEAPRPIGFLSIGWGGISGDTAHHRSVGLGIALAAPFRGKGYGSEAINWALDWAFRYGNFHRVYLGTVSYNERAQHLYKKLGFVEEGRSREAHWFDRKWHDLISYGMLEQEWEALRGIKKE